MSDVIAIPGVRIEVLAPARSGSALAPSYIELADQRPMNIVFHGHGRPFSYQYFGIHQGTEDRLTFIGPQEKTVRAYFIDCRQESPTWGMRTEATLTPSISKVLVIPPGVAHTFDGLEDIYTLNSFRNFLPDPNDWISGKIEWGLGADTINLPRDVSDADIPVIEFNRLEASDYFYYLTARNLMLQQSDEVQEYPLTKRFRFDDATTKLLKFKKRSERRVSVPKHEPVAEIDGVCWLRRSFVTGSDAIDSGYTTFIRPEWLRIFEAGSRPTTITNYDLGECSLRHLTFLGRPDASVEISLSTGSRSKRFFCNPSPLRELVVPAHVLITISNLQDVIVTATGSSLVDSPSWESTAAV